MNERNKCEHGRINSLWQLRVQNYQRTASFIDFSILSTEETLCVLVTIDSKSRVDISYRINRSLSRSFSHLLSSELYRNARAAFEFVTV